MSLKGYPLRAKPEHFYKELDGEFLSKYQWNPEPTTGAYVALAENVDKGKSVTLVRQKNWWADQKRFFRYRFNPEKIRVSVVRDYNKAFEIFLKVVSICSAWQRQNFGMINYRIIINWFKMVIFQKLHFLIKRHLHLTH